jgi:tetratricopeptide (TPR) repeat protein
MVRALAALLMILALPALTACGAVLSDPFTPPESGGAPWVQITSPHIILRTDLSASEARDAVVEFEGMYSMLEDVAFPSDQKPQIPTRVVLFRREAEYREIGPASSSGYFNRAGGIDGVGVPTAVFYGDITNETRNTFLHELTHRFVAFYYPKSPSWLNEGLAEYFATMSIEGEKIVLGRRPPNKLVKRGTLWWSETAPGGDILIVPSASIPKVEDLRAMDPGDFYTGRLSFSSPEEKLQNDRRQTANYSGAFALVHLLKNGPEPYRARFEVFMAQLGANGPKRAWEAAFNGVEPEVLERDFQEWLTYRELILLQKPYAPRGAGVEEERPMTPAEVHLVWATIRPWGSDVHRSRARADIEAAIRLAPDTPAPKLWRARLHRAEGRTAEAEEDLKDALATSPNDADCIAELLHIYVEQMKENGPEEQWARADALATRLMKLATTVNIQNNTAWYLATRGRTDEGLPLAVRAVSSDPSCWACLDTLALLLFQKGAIHKAVEAQTIAAGLMPEGVRDASVTARLRRYQAAERKLQAAKKKEQESAAAGDSPRSTP